MPRRSTFALDIKRFAEATETDVDEVKKRATLQVFTDIVQNTPVDTGRAKGSWTIGNGGLPKAYRKRKDKGGGLTIAQGAKKINASKVDESLFISTNLVYMPPLEYGWSKQAPRGMVRIAVRRWNRYARNVVRSLRKRPSGGRRQIRRAGTFGV